MAVRLVHASPLPLALEGKRAQDLGVTTCMRRWAGSRREPAQRHTADALCRKGQGRAKTFSTNSLSWRSSR